KETASPVARASPAEAPRKPNRTAPHSKHGYSANFTGRPGTTPKTTTTTNAVVTRNRPASIIRQSEGQTGGTSRRSLNASTSGAKMMMPTTSAIHHASQASAKGVPDALRKVSAPRTAPTGTLTSPHTHARPRTFLSRSSLNGEGNRDRRSQAAVPASSVLASQ